MGIVRSYSDLEIVFQNLCSEHGVQPFVFGKVDGYNLWSAHIPSSFRGNKGIERPALLVTAGLHGDEIAGVKGLIYWLRRILTQKERLVNVTVVPCLNPHGYERDVRTNVYGQDPNRLFKFEREPLPTAVRSLLAIQKFDVAIDLHEDWELEGFYLYELKESSPFLGSTVSSYIKQMQWELSHGDQVDEFDSLTKYGVVRGDCGRSEACRIPMQLMCRYIYRYFAEHVLCVETPQKLELELRVAMHARVLDNASEFVAMNNNLYRH